MFRTQTDTEVIAHLIHAHWHAEGGGDLLAAVQHGDRRVPRRVRDRRDLDARAADASIGARQGSPLLVGIGDARSLPRLRRVGADAGHAARRVPRGRRRRRRAARVVRDLRRARASASSAPIVEVQGDGDAVELGPYRHFMQKEIFEQPRAVADTLEGIARIVAGAVRRQGRRRSCRTSIRVLILACGTSYYSSLVAQAVDRDARADAVHGRDRQRIPLSRQRAAREGAGRRRVAVGRDRRHARRAEAREVARPPRTRSRSATSRRARWCGRPSSRS